MWSAASVGPERLLPLRPGQVHAAVLPVAAKLAIRAPCLPLKPPAPRGPGVGSKKIEHVLLREVTMVASIKPYADELALGDGRMLIGGEWVTAVEGATWSHAQPA